jgi:hypothetical protein
LENELRGTSAALFPVYFGIRVTPVALAPSYVSLRSEKTNEGGRRGGGSQRATGPTLPFLGLPSDSSVPPRVMPRLPLGRYPTIGRIMTPPKASPPNPRYLGSCILHGKGELGP